jgi:hypothetical protein
MVLALPWLPHTARACQAADLGTRKGRLTLRSFLNCANMPASGRTNEVFQMFHIRTQFALRALPVSTVADGGDANAGLDYSRSSTPRDNTALPRRHFGGIAAQF